MALTPQDFVSFWLRHPWNEVSEWTGQAGRASLKALHERYKGTNSEFTPPTCHCTLHPDLWQVATDPGANPRPTSHYFLIRGLLPFRFMMVVASDRPWADCTKDDPAVDKAPDLFGNQHALPCSSPGISRPCFSTVPESCPNPIHSIR